MADCAAAGEPLSSPAPSAHLRGCGPHSVSAPFRMRIGDCGGVTLGDVEGGQYLFRHQADQFACGRGGAEDPDRRGAMPALSSELASAMPHDTFRPRATANRNPRLSHTARIDPAWNAGIDGTPGVRDSTALAGKSGCRCG